MIEITIDNVDKKVVGDFEVKLSKENIMI